jgi:hypothetical protein
MCLLILIRHNIFERKTVISLHTVESRVRNYYCRLWKDDVKNVSKLRNYVTFKTEFEQKHYIKLNLEKNEWSYLAQFRCGILPIRIETGRYIGERPEDRLCRFCGDQEIENESHFLLDYTFYREIRTFIFGDLLTSNSFVNMDRQGKERYMMTHCTSKMAKYIVHAFQKRRRAIFTLLFRASSKFRLIYCFFLVKSWFFFIEKVHILRIIFVNAIALLVFGRST